MKAQITKETENVKSKRKFNKKESEEKLKIICKNSTSRQQHRIVKDIQRGDEKLGMSFTFQY